MKPSRAPNDNLVDHTRQVWQTRFERDLTREDVRQIAENVTGFFGLLAEWSRAEMPSPTSDTTKPATSEDRTPAGRLAGSIERPAASLLKAGRRG